MSTTQFKLTKRDGLTRRIVFPTQPSWHTLASRIGALYAIPIDRIAVSYVDSDNDEVTLSSEEEIQDFYHGSHRSDQAIKFIVEDLSSSRDARSLSSTFGGANDRNTFGQEPSPFGIQDDWERLPTFSVPRSIYIANTPGSDSPHAFVEAVASSASDSADGNTTIRSETGKHFEVSMDKGKEKVADASASSTGSVLNASAPPKHPVHVYDLSAHHPGSTHSTIVPIGAESTPRVVPQSLASEPAQNAPTPQGYADPPLPSFDQDQAPQNASSSLVNDVANILTTLTNIVGTHPELSEGIRNIIHNASNGTYWGAHRESMPQAAQGMTWAATGRPTEEMHRGTEDEAGRRVADAIGGIFRSLSSMAGGIVPPSLTTEDPTRVTNEPSSFDPCPPRPTSRPPQSWRDGFHGGALGHSTRGPLPFIPSSTSRWGWGPPTARHSPRAGIPHHDSPRGYHPHGDDLHLPPLPPPLPHGSAWWAPPPPLPPHPANAIPLKPTIHELKERLSAVKATYLAEKEQYRRELDQARKERDQKARIPSDRYVSPFLHPRYFHQMSPSQAYQTCSPKS